MRQLFFCLTGLLLTVMSMAGSENGKQHVNNLLRKRLLDHRQKRIFGRPDELKVIQKAVVSTLNAADKSFRWKIDHSGSYYEGLQITRKNSVRDYDFMLVTSNRRFEVEYSSEDLCGSDFFVSLRIKQRDPTLSGYFLSKHNGSFYLSPKAVKDFVRRQVEASLETVGTNAATSETEKLRNNLLKRTTIVGSESQGAGPAVTLKVKSGTNSYTIDFVPAVELFEWPKVSIDWTSNWLALDTVSGILSVKKTKKYISDADKPICSENSIAPLATSSIDHVDQSTHPVSSTDNDPTHTVSAANAKRRGRPPKTNPIDRIQAICSENSDLPAAPSPDDHVAQSAHPVSPTDNDPTQAVSAAAAAKQRGRPPKTKSTDQIQSTCSKNSSSPLTTSSIDQVAQSTHPVQTSQPVELKEGSNSDDLASAASADVDDDDSESDDDSDSEDDGSNVFPSVVTKNHPSEFELPMDQSRLWRVSFSKAEKFVIKNRSNVQSCIKDVIRLLKEDLEQVKSGRGMADQKGFCSFYLKNVVLKLAESESGWTRDDLAERYIDALRETVRSLQTTPPRVESYFIPGANLMELKEISDKLRKSLIDHFNHQMNYYNGFM